MDYLIYNVKTGIYMYFRVQYSGAVYLVFLGT